MYRFLLSRRWLAYLGLAALFALGCVLLSRWQMARLAEAGAVLDRVGRNYDAAPVPFAQAADQFARLSAGREWQQVSLRGMYDTGATRVVRNRPLDGQPGYEVVVPLRLETGETVVVDRGWLPIGNRDPGRPDLVPAPPAGEVRVVVRLRPGEPELPRGAPEGQLASIDLPAYARQLPYQVLTGAYGQLAEESPAAEATPVGRPKPEPNNGMHLSYALQWLAFAVLMFVGFGYAARQQARNDAIDAVAAAGPGDAGAPASAGATAARFGPARRRRPTAEEEEDALLDAQGYS